MFESRRITNDWLSHIEKSIQKQNLYQIMVCLEYNFSIFMRFSIFIVFFFKFYNFYKILL